MVTSTPFSQPEVVTLSSELLIGAGIKYIARLRTFDESSSECRDQSNCGLHCVCRIPTPAQTLKYMFRIVLL